MSESPPATFLAPDKDRLCEDVMEDRRDGRV